MTAAASTDDDPTLPIFRSAVEAYLERNRGREHATILGRNAQAAGLAAVRNWWERHPSDGETVYEGHRAVHDTTEKDRLKAAGWTCLGYSTFYFMAPPAAVDGAT